MDQTLESLEVPYNGDFDGKVLLRIDCRFLPSTMDFPPGKNHIYLISASISTLAPFCDRKASWLIDIAKLICEPHGSGQLLTFRAGDSAYWFSQPCIPSEWQVVRNEDELKDRIYEYIPGTNSTLLAGIAPLRGYPGLTSIPPESRSGSAASFRRQVKKRDVTCVVTGDIRPYVTRLLLQRLGDDNTRRIIQTYVHSASLRPSTALDCFHPTLGILLTPNIDAYVSRFDIGFWKSPGRGPNSYILHCFLDDPYRLNLYGGPPWPSESIPLMHGHKVDLVAHSSEVSLPPSGIFDWHYLQCAVRQFGTAEYKNMPSVKFDQVSYQSNGNEYIGDPGDAEAGLNQKAMEVDEIPYPSYRFETAIADATQKLENVKLFEDVAKWAGSVQEADKE